MIISMLSYTQSHHLRCLQKLLAIYFKFHGITAKGFDTLHAIALMMSHKWTCDAVGWISKEAMIEVIRLINIYLWLLTHDNIDIASQHVS